MKLSNKIISDFIETTSNDKSIKKETFIQGYVVKDKNSGLYLGVRLLNDNSGKIIPAKVPSNINAEYPVNIMIKNHSASIISNVYPDTTSSKNSNIINNISQSIWFKMWTFPFGQEVPAWACLPDNRNGAVSLRKHFVKQRKRRA